MNKYLAVLVIAVGLYLVNTFVRLTESSVSFMDSLIFFLPLILAGVICLIMARMVAKTYFEMKKENEKDENIN
jgi:hypothetical protein